MVLTILLEAINMKLQWQNKKKITSNTIDDERRYIDKYNSIPWGHNPTS